MGKELFGAIVTGLVGTAIVSLFGAVMLRAAAKWIADMKVPFGKAYSTAFIAYFIILIIRTLLWFAVGFVAGSAGLSSGPEHTTIMAMQTILIPISLFVQAIVVRLRLPVTFGKGLLISLVMTVLGVVIVIAGSLVAFGIARIVW